MKLTLAAVALVGLSAPAFAADIDEITPYAMPDIGVAEKGANLTQARSGGKKTTATRTKSTARGTVQQRQVNNGNRTTTATRTQQQRPVEASAHRSNGDWAHASGTRTRTNTAVTTTNGNRTASREWSGNQRQAEVNGVRNGQRFDGTVNQRRGTVTNTQTNARTGATVTRTNTAAAQRINGHKGGHPVNRTVVANGNGHHRPGAANPAIRAHTRPPTVVRPGPHGTTVVRHGGPARPGTVVVNRPARPGTVVVNRPHAVHRPAVRTVTYTRVRPYHGVFVYGPRPATHVHYVNGRAAGPVKVKQVDMPSRDVDRANSLALGVKGGSLISGTPTGQVYGDPGLSLVGRYRPAESVGLEMALGHHASSFSPTDARAQTQLAGSVALFAFPWTRVSPYVIGGVTWNGANFQDEVWVGDGYDAVRSVDSQFGLHGGLGLELALGKSFALDFEGRYIGWLDERQANEAPGAIQATAGLLFHFK